MQNKASLHRAGVEGDPSSSATALGIREVSALLSVPAPTIRSWERRHALSTVARDEHGHRRYTGADVAVLRRIRDERANGVRASEAVATATVPPPLVLCRQLLAATHRLDGEGVSTTLDRSVTAHGLPATVEEVLLPSMREVGAQWSRGQCDVAQEHLTTAAVLAWLAGRAAEAPPPLHDQPIVLSCGPQDQHTIALEAFTVLLRHHRFDCRNLGAQTPAASLRAAVDQSAARAVVLVSQLGRSRPAAVAALRAVKDSGAALFYAGAAFRSTASRHELPGHYLGGNLTQAADHITTHLRRT
jgi:methanogenic corrinoid protein MtbC1